MTNRINPATAAEVRRLYTEGHEMLAIAGQLGLTYKQVSHACRELPKRTKWTADQARATIALLTKRLKRPPTLTELGAQWGMTGAGAGAVLQRCGVEKPRTTAPAPELRRRAAMAERKSKRRAAMAKRRSTRDAKILAMSKHKRQHKKTRQEIADALDVHVNVVYRVLREAKS